MYEATDDPYCYPGTSVLKNRLDLRDQSELDRFEATISTQRADEPLPVGRLDTSHYRALHRHLFQDVYEWAGEFRTVRIAKQASMFCYPENIEREMQRLFGELAAEGDFRTLPVDEFASKAAHFLAELNAIHPFREGNGRTQVFLTVLARDAGHALDFERLRAPDMMQAMIASFAGDEKPLADPKLGARPLKSAPRLTRPWSPDFVAAQSRLRPTPPPRAGAAPAAAPAPHRHARRRKRTARASRSRRRRPG
jgi:cell filamentation protein